MRLARPRFTLRHLMLTVLLVAALLGAFEAGRRWEGRLRAVRAEAALARFEEAIAREQAAVRVPAPMTTTIPELVEPAAFAAWPSLTDKPVRVGPDVWLLCRSPTPQEARARDAATKAHGPHAGGSIVVRVSPDALAPFRAGDPLPAGAVVIKQKHEDGRASLPMHEYAMMVKRDAGYDPAGGDWEYAYVTLVPERRVTRGRLPQCAGCHATARRSDYLFRSYVGAGR
jgi:hypothetical protein